MPRKIINITICLLLAACSLPGAQSASQPQAWFDMPLSGTVFFPPNPCKIIAHGASSDGIAAFEFSVNGAFASGAPGPGSNQSLATINTNCPALSPGENLIELRVKNKAGLWSDSTQTTVILAQESVITETPSPRGTDTPVSTFTPSPTVAATLTSTLTATPTLAPVLGPPDEVSITSVSTWVVYVGDSSCGPMETVITAHATASKGITDVILFFRFPGTDFQNISMSPIGNDLYHGSISMFALFGNSIPFDQSIPEYQVVVQQRDGDTSLRTPLLADIEVRACSFPSIEIDPCSANVDQRACIANGCNWWEIAGTPPTFVCRSKP